MNLSTAVAILPFTIFPFTLRARRGVIEQLQPDVVALHRRRPDRLAAYDPWSAGALRFGRRLGVLPAGPCLPKTDPERLLATIRRLPPKRPRCRDAKCVTRLRKMALDGKPCLWV